jgi:hypothetical protein
MVHLKNRGIYCGMPCKKNSRNYREKIEGLGNVHEKVW